MKSCEAPKRGDKNELEITPEQELKDGYIITAEKAIRDLLVLKPEEKILIITDQKTSPEMRDVLKKTIENIGNKFVCITLNKEKREDLQKWLREYDIIIDIEDQNNEATKELHNEDINNSSKARMLSLLDMGVEIFRKGGPMTVPLEYLEKQMEKMENELSRAAGFRITSSYGTNLEIGLKPASERKNWCRATGAIKNPGDWDNWPGGEVFTVPDETKTNGVVVLPVIDSYIDPAQGVDKLIKINFRDGRITSIQGGESAEKLRATLEKDALYENEKGGDPAGVYHIAEFSFGANEKAGSTVSDPNQPYYHKGISVVEAEKKLGTCHFAVGFNILGNEGGEGKIKVSSHYDFVLPRNGLTVEMFTNEDDFSKKQNGRKIIDEGRFNLL
ncbi:MAG: aminopeptidase [Patescibacteria group bacterium]